MGPRGLKGERTELVLEMLKVGPRTTEGMRKEIVKATGEMSDITLRKLCTELARSKTISVRKVRCKRHPAGVLVWTKPGESDEAVTALVKQIDSSPNSFSGPRATDAGGLHGR